MFWAVLNLYTNTCQIKEYQHGVDCSCCKLWFKWHLSENLQPVMKLLPEQNKEAIFPAEKELCWIHNDGKSLWSDEGVCQKNGWWVFKLNGLLCATEGNVTLNYDALCTDLWVSKVVKKSKWWWWCMYTTPLIQLTLIVSIRFIKTGNRHEWKIMET